MPFHSPYFHSENISYCSNETNHYLYGPILSILVTEGTTNRSKMCHHTHLHYCICSFDLVCHEFIPLYHFIAGRNGSLSLPSIHISSRTHNLKQTIAILNDIYTAILIAVSTNVTNLFFPADVFAGNKNGFSDNSAHIVRRM